MLIEKLEMRWDDKQIKGTDGNSTTPTINTLMAALHDKSVY